MKDYKRLTERDDSLCVDCADIGFCRKTCIRQARYERLQFLENKIESGEIVELPCKVGDIVYCIHGMSNPELKKCQVKEIILTDHNFVLLLGQKRTKKYRSEFSNFYNVWWFTDRAEAEARLAELKGEQK